MAPAVALEQEAGRRRLRATGEWTVAHAPLMERLAPSLVATGEGAVAIDLGGVERLDTMGAWLLERAVRDLRLGGTAAELVDIPARFQGLFNQIEHTRRRKAADQGPARGPLAALERLGRGTVAAFSGFGELLDMLGAVAVALVRAILRPKNLRLTSIVHHLDRVGWQAIGIIVLITLLIGAIIAQQGFFYFRRFGAADYTVNLVGILVLRELGVLIVAIMVAGRSGSAYTAELGSMKMREEVDALRTMGIDPVEILVLPRIIALVIALPILTFIGSIAALIGGELVAWSYGGMSPTVYWDRLQGAVSMTDFRIGMIKAPIMAFAIGLVACVEGLKVQGSAESLGIRTTASVVKAIFLVIVLDGFFAMFFASIGM